MSAAEWAYKRELLITPYGYPLETELCVVMECWGEEHFAVQGM